jgi:hypothetical protein
MQKILYLLRNRLVKLQIETSEAGNEYAHDKLSKVKCRGQELRFKLVKRIFEVLWDLYLLKSSILVTRTPLITLKSLLCNRLDLAFINALKHNLVNGVTEVNEALIGALVSDLKFRVRNLQVHRITNRLFFRLNFQQVTMTLQYLFRSAKSIILKVNGVR